MNYYDEFIGLEKEVDKKLTAYRTKKNRLSKETEYRQIAERKAVEVFNKEKGTIINEILKYFSKQMQIYSQYTDRNGQFENRFVYNDTWLVIKDEDGMFLHQEKARKSFEEKFCRLVTRELILNTPASYEFYTSLEKQTTEDKKFHSKLSVLMVFLKER